VTLLEDKTDTIKTAAETLIDAGKVVSPKVNAEKSQAHDKDSKQIF
jgi:hypothetical protein